MMTIPTPLAGDVPAEDPHHCPLLGPPTQQEAQQPQVGLTCHSYVCSSPGAGETGLLTATHSVWGS